MVISRASPNRTCHREANNHENGTRSASSSGKNQPVFQVTVPDFVRPGEVFQVYAGGRIVRVQCPTDAVPGQSLQLTVPDDAGTVPARDMAESAGLTETRPPYRQDSGNYQVEVPPGVQPGSPFAVMANGVRVLVSCPLNASPGQQIRFSLPRRDNVEENTPVADGCWARRIQKPEMKYQWVRINKEGRIDNPTSFDIRNSGFVRKLELHKGYDSRFRQGVLSLVSANEAVMDPKVKDLRGRLMVDYCDIDKVQKKIFEEKVVWFHRACSKFTVAWESGHMKMRVRRNHLLSDSFDAVMSLGRGDLRKLWRFGFIGEEGIDAGGVTREWFHLVTQQIFDPDMGLWQSSNANQNKMRINPNLLYCEEGLMNYRFIGRVLGKALFDQQICVGRMVPYMYKHLLGWPVTFADLETDDEEYYNNLKQLGTLVESGQDLSTLCLDFTTSQEIFGSQEEVELIEGGADVELTNERFPGYLEACLKYRLFESVKKQINELLLGFFDIIPEPLLAVFDCEEIELLICGKPTIDVEDWRLHTEYEGAYSDTGGDHPVCIWFWEVVESFEEEEKARLLQFVTGTTGVPSRGFAVLQSNDGNVRKFTIHGVSLESCLYPTAHTCFNRIDLPVYNGKEELKENLRLAMTMCAQGFHLE